MRGIDLGTQTYGWKKLVDTFVLAAGWCGSVTLESNDQPEAGKEEF